MKRLVFLAWVLLGTGVAGASERLDALLAEAQLEMRPPEGYREIGAGRTSIMDYEHALRGPDGDLEIRVAIRPLRRRRIEYNDPHGSTPDPEHVFPLVFESLLSRLAGGRHAPSNAYPPGQAREKFNADWAAAGVFDTTADFSSDFSQGLLVAIHRNGVADAYVVLLFDDYDRIRPKLGEALAVMRFAPAVTNTSGGELGG